MLRPENTLFCYVCKMEIEDGKEAVSVAKGLADVENVGIKNATLLYIHRICYPIFIQMEDIVVKEFIIFQEIRDLVTQQYKIGLTFNQIRHLENKDKLIKRLRAGLKVEWGWILTYKATIYDISEDGAKYFIEGDGIEDHLEFKDIEWCPEWQEIN